MLSKYRLWCLLFMLIFVASCAGSASYMKASETLNERPPDDKALVRFMRPYKFSGSARNFFVLDQEKAIGNNPVSTQFDYLAAPGKHLFISGAAGARKSFLEADLEGGRIYYVIVSLNLTGVRLIPVKKNSEYWDKVKKYETSLKKLMPNTEILTQWEQDNRLEIQKLMSYYETSPKDSHSNLMLSPDDGV